MKFKYRKAKYIEYILIAVLVVFGAIFTLTPLAQHISDMFITYAPHRNASSDSIPSTITDSKMKALFDDLLTKINSLKNDPTDYHKIEAAGSLGKLLAELKNGSYSSDYWSYAEQLTEQAFKAANSSYTDPGGEIHGCVTDFANCNDQIVNGVLVSYVGMRYLQDSGNDYYLLFALGEEKDQVIAYRINDNLIRALPPDYSDFPDIEHGFYNYGQPLLGNSYIDPTKAFYGLATDNHNNTGGPNTVTKFDLSGKVNCTVADWDCNSHITNLDDYEPLPTDFENTNNIFLN